MSTIVRTEKFTKGGLWSPAAGYASPKRINAKMLVGFEGTGAQIAALSAADLNPGFIAFCSTTGSGFTVDKYYRRDSTNTSWSNAFPTVRENFISNLPSNIFWLNKICVVSQKNGGIISTSGASTVVDRVTDGAIRLETGNVEDTHCDIGWDGFLISFASAITVIIKFDTNANRNVRARIGIAVDPITSNDVTQQNQFGLTINNLTPGINMSLFSANGTAWSKVLSSVGPHVPGNERIRLEHDPSIPSIKVYKRGLLNTTKTNSIPTSGTNGSGRIFYAGIATRENDSKRLTLWGFEIIGNKGESFGP